MIQLDRLTKRFPTGKYAVNQLSLSVQPGEVYALLGPNGAGKTTTLRMMLGMLPPTSGDVTIQGFRVSEHPLHIKRLIGLVSASAGLYQWLTPREILKYFAVGYGIPLAQIDARIHELSELIQLQGFIDQRCATLSTGQKQRVNLARALVHNPPVVLLDEPTLGLDIVGTRIVFEYVIQLREAGKSVIVCTHQLDEAERLCDRFGLLHRGELHYEGTLAQLQQSTGKESLVDIFLEMLEQDAREGVIHD
jgi:ABC-2 type transport system ATP-binding protein/sodium transport system ATP-binding protein